MTKKEAFMTIVGKEIFERADIYAENYPDIYEDARIYFESLQSTKEENKPKFTDNGKLILSFMRENVETYNNLFKAKDMGEGIGISSRSVSGSVRKLAADGYVEKLGENPIVYALTELGRETDPNVE